MAMLMVKFPVGRARVAALILSCVGITLAVAAPPAAAQPTAYREAPADALARNMRLLATSPKSFDALIGAGKSALALGDTHAAAGFFGRAEEVHPASPLPHAGMGAAMVIEGDALAALPYFNRAQQLGANGAMLGADRGLAYDLLGRHAEAQQDYRAALYGADADEARRRLALSLAITGDKNGALAQLAPLVARGDAAGARCRALVLALTGDVDGARRSIDAAMPGASAQMAPFLLRLTGLSSGQKAAAVNLGIFPGGGQPAYAGPGATGDRLASVDDLLRAPVQAQPVPRPVQPQPQPVRVASATPSLSTIMRPPATPTRTDSEQGGRPRIWLQLASGSNVTALPDQFRRIKSRNKELFDGISGYVAESAGKARLLIGPFRSNRDADIFAGDLASIDVDAFSWTNPAGQTIRKISSE